jgi:NADH:ubiquinone oxidoreductase subunit C
MMTNEDFKIKIAGLVPSAIFDETGEWLNILVDSSLFRSMVQQLRSDNDTNLDYLFCLTCIDWKTHLTVVYHLSSASFRHNIVVKVNLDRNNPEIETVCDIWRGAELFEREVYEMFGVTFLNHPDLRRLILPDDWNGWPLRKDYDDPINMIKL